MAFGQPSEGAPRARRLNTGNGVLGLDMLVRAMRSTKLSGGGRRAMREPDAVVYLLDCKQVPSAAGQDER